MTWMRPLLPGAVLLLAACASAGGQSGPEGTMGQQLLDSYSGSWSFDVNDSENTREKMGEAMRRGQGFVGGGGRGGGRGRGGRGGEGGAGRGGRGGGGGPPGGGRGGGGGGRGGGEGQDGAMQAVMRPPRTMGIEVSASSVTLSLPNGISHLVPMDGETHESETAGGVMEFEAKWDGDVLEVTREARGGLKVRDRYELGETDRLVVKRKVNLPGGRGSFEVKLAYNRVESRG